MKDCPFCSIEKKTEWFLKEKDLVVCEDLDSKNFKLRILVVFSGKPYHKPYESYRAETIEYMLQKGIDVVNKLIQEGRINRIENIDISHFKVRNHFHLQIGVM